MSAAHRVQLNRRHDRHRCKKGQLAGTCPSLLRHELCPKLRTSLDEQGNASECRAELRERVLVDVTDECSTAPSPSSGSAAWTDRLAAWRVRRAGRGGRARAGP